MPELDELRAQFERFRSRALMLIASLFVTVALLASLMFLKGGESDRGVIEGRLIVLRDSSGTVRVELGVDEADGGVSRLRLFDENGKSRIVAIARATKAHLGVTSADLVHVSAMTEQMIGIKNTQSRRNAVLTISPATGPTFVLTSDDGNSDVGLLAGNDVSGLRVKINSGREGRSVMVGSDLDGQPHVIFRVGETPHLYLGLDGKSVPALHTWTPAGEIDQQLLPRLKP